MKPDTIRLDGRAYSWRALVEARRRQLEAWRASQGEQPALFELKDDVRPVIERSADRRYAEPSLLDWRPESE